MTRASGSLRSTAGWWGVTSIDVTFQVSTALLACGPGRDPRGARSVRYPVEDDGNEHRKRRDVEDPLALGDPVAREDQQRERHRRHSLRPEPGHEGARGHVGTGSDKRG